MVEPVGIIMLSGKYYVEYTLQRPGEKQRHLVSVVGIASNGWVNRLYTVTGQYFEEDAAKYKSNVEKVHDHHVHFKWLKKLFLYVLFLKSMCPVGFLFLHDSLAQHFELLLIVQVISSFKFV